MLDAAIHPASRARAGLAVQRQVPGGRQKVIGRVFGIQPHFNCMTVQRDLLLRDRQRLALGNPDLPGHQVEAGNRFGHRMLHLQPRVHLHEEKLATGIQQKLHRTCADIPDGLGSAHGRFAHGPALLDTQAGCRGFFHDLLMTTLDRAVAFIEVQAMTLLVGKHLDLDMPRLEQVFLHQHLPVAERRQRLTLGGGQGFGQLADVLDHLHALATAARRGLEQHRVADTLTGGAEGLQVLGLAVITRHKGYASRFHQGLGRGFAAHGVDCRGGRAEEDQACRLDGPGEAGVFREEAVAGVNRLGAAGVGGGNQLVDLQVTIGGLAAAQVDADIGFTAMAGIAVDGAVHSHGGQPHGLGGTHDPAGDFATVGHQNGVECAHERGSWVCQLGARFCRNARKPSWPSALTRMRAMAFSQ